MESEKERYYRAENQKRISREHKESGQETAILLLKLSAAAAVTLLALILISPGALVVGAVTYTFQIQLHWAMAWLLGLIISTLLLIGIWFYTKNKAKISFIYLAIVTLSSSVIYFYPPTDQNSFLNHTLHVYLPILNTNKHKNASPQQDIERELIEEAPTDNHSKLPQQQIAAINDLLIINKQASTQTEFESENSSSPDVDTMEKTDNTHQKIQPSFDCSLANHRFEILVCEDPELSALDVQLNSLYTTTRSQLSPEDRKTLLEQQRDWIKQSRLCSTTACISNAYKMRIDQIYPFQSR